MEPFLEGFYKVQDIDGAQRLFKKLKTVYQGQLDYYDQMDVEEQHANIERIFSSLQGYGRILTMVQNNDDPHIAGSEKTVFESYMSRFEHLIAYD